MPPKPNHCPYCHSASGQHQWTIDHFVPLSRGGRDELDNYVWCCQRCNNIKDSTLFENVPWPGKARAAAVIADCVRQGLGREEAWLRVRERKLPIGLMVFAMLADAAYYPDTMERRGEQDAREANPHDP